MDKFLIRKPQDSSSSSSSSKWICVDLNNLPSDPGLREKISSYHPNDQDDIRKAYIQVVIFKFCNEHWTLWKNFLEPPLIATVPFW